MRKFIESINEGMQKAADAEAARLEVGAIFDAINSELCEVSGGKDIRIVLSSDLFFRNTMDGRWAYGKYLGSDCIKLSLMAEEKNVESVPVANWRQSVDGYPCMVLFDDNEYVCFNSDDLSNTLMELFRSPDFGRVLYAMTKR